jgi:flagellar basal body rod protein FlgG
MKSKKMTSDIFRGILILCVGVLLISGCDAVLTVGGRTMGVRSGNFIYTDGYLTSSYNFPIDKVWKACEKTLTDMKASSLDKKMKISTGAMTAVIQDDKIQINVEYASQTLTLDRKGRQQYGVTAHSRENRRQPPESCRTGKARKYYLNNSPVTVKKNSYSEG